MAWWPLIIVIVGGLFILASLFWPLPEPLTDEQKAIDIVREAAFAVIEASLEAEPEKWQPTMRDGVVYWLTNKEAGIAIWVSSSCERLYILEEKAWKSRSDDGRLNPPIEMRARIYTAAMKIVSKKLEETEEERLLKMVDNFRVKKEEMNNDQKSG